LTEEKPVETCCRPGESPAIPSDYASVLAAFSPQELAVLPQIKRFFECLRGDPVFAASAADGSFLPENRHRLKQIGINFNVDEFALLWKSPRAVGDYLEAYSKGVAERLPVDTLETVNAYPLFTLWARFVRLKSAFENHVRRRIIPVHTQPEFNAWRSRRVLSARSELGYYGYTINHPVLSFELSDGCSVGCWFCAFAAHRLQGVLDYTENKELFRGVVQTCIDLFGQEQAATAMLYCGTEPHDNPSYMRFLEDYTELTGTPPFTSTAVAHDIDYIKEITGFYRRGPYAALRISVLSQSMLSQIHNNFSPDELRDTDLLMQMKEGGPTKVTSGRILKNQEGLRSCEAGDSIMGCSVPQGTIECMSGLLINLVTRTIRVISPCYSSPRWPYGFRIFDTATFSSVQDFKEAVHAIIERSMPESPQNETPIRFRDDLVYRPTEQGFDLVSPNQVHHFTPKETWGFAGELIAEGSMTYGGLCASMTDKEGYNFISGIWAVKKLFELGLVDEVYNQ
jgi:radical SAM family RiPP maturation amino acid epimerase